MSGADFTYDFPHRHLTRIGDLNRVDVDLLYRRAEHHLTQNRQPDKSQDSMRGLTQVNLFFEPSTRTLCSFEMAGKRLGAHVVNFSASASSTAKGESLKDTVLTLKAMQTDVFVIRHPSPGSAQFVADTTGVPTINGGDGANEHPTQALYDCFTLGREIGDLGGKRVVIIGDILHSRVARSNVALLNLFNADVRLCGPEALLPPEAQDWGASLYHDLDEALDGAHAAMALRIQKERFEGTDLPDEDSFFERFGLNHDRLKNAHPDCKIMHPGPMNRGVEIDGDLADDPEKSLILKQVEAGVALRMAVLEFVTGRAPDMTHRETST